MTTETTTEQARDLAEKLNVEIARQREARGDMMYHGQPDQHLTDAAVALRSLADQVERLSALDQEYGRVESAIILADKEFDGDSDHANCGDRLIASIHRLEASNNHWPGWYIDNSGIKRAWVTHAMLNEAKAAELTKERDALKKANAEAMLLIDEINKRISSRQFYGINQPLHSKLCTIRSTLARAALNAGAPLK